MKKVIIIFIVLIIIVGVGAYLLGQKSSEKIPEVAVQTTPVIENQNVDTNTIEHSTLLEQKEASGIIKSVYNKDGKDYIDIDYIEWNAGWKPGGATGPAYKNDNTQIRTFEISPDAKFFSANAENNSITFSDFKNYFVAGSSNYQKYNPWDITVVGPTVIQIREHYLP